MTKKFSLFVSNVSKECAFCCIEIEQNIEKVIDICTFSEDNLLEELKNCRVKFQAHSKTLTMNISNKSVSFDNDVAKLAFKIHYAPVINWDMLRYTAASIIDKNIIFHSQLTQIKVFRDISSSMNNRQIKPVLGSLALISQKRREGAMIDLFEIHKML